MDKESLRDQFFVVYLFFGPNHPKNLLAYFRNGLYIILYAFSVHKLVFTSQELFRLEEVSYFSNGNISIKAHICYCSSK